MLLERSILLTLAGWQTFFFLEHQAPILTKTAKLQRGMGILQLIVDEESCC